MSDLGTKRGNVDAIKKESKEMKEDAAARNCEPMQLKNEARKRKKK